MLIPAVATALISVAGVATAADPPPNPTDGQISTAQQQKEALATQVGQLSAQVVQMQTQLNQLQAAQELAEQKLADALDKLDQARQASTAAAAGVQAAKDRVAQAEREYRAYVASTYMSGSIGGTTGSLLTAADPNVVLEHGALEKYEAEHQLDAIGNLKSATVAKSNADAVARAAVQRQKQATDNAATAKQNADAAVVSAREQTQQLQAQLASNQTALDQAQEQLATLNNQREQYIAWQKEQARLRAIARAKKLAAERAARLAAQRAAERAREQQQQQQNSGGGGGGGGDTNAPAPTPSGGSWNSSRGWDAVHRAENYLGTMYAWAGGNASGPTYGVCAGDGAFNDCHIRGFDCSGLVLYAWAPYLRMAHYAATQYWQAGSYHPSLSNLRPGDLLFWSSNGSQSGIHHVAMYVGNGNVIQAPESGSVIQITPVGDVSWGYFGATRPLT